MTGDRLPSHLEAAGLLRCAESAGGFGTILKKGDADRGSILLFLASRGTHFACLERVLTAEGRYAWHIVGPSESSSSTQIGDYLASRARFDEDIWAIELDIADPERFIAETKLMG